MWKSESQLCLWIITWKPPYFLKTSHFGWTDGKQCAGACWMKQLPSEQPRHVSDTNETCEIFKSPRLSLRNRCGSPGVALGMPGTESVALKIGCVIIFLIMRMTVIYSLPHPPRQRPKRKNKKMLSVIKTKNVQRSWCMRNGSVSASEDEICLLDLISNH